MPEVMSPMGPQGLDCEVGGKMVPTTSPVGPVEATEASLVKILPYVTQSFSDLKYNKVLLGKRVWYHRTIVAFRDYEP